MMLNSMLREIRDNIGQNSFLSYLERNQVKSKKINYPPVFIVGPPRTGSTLLYQILTTFSDFNYFSNFSSFFYGSPIVSYKLSKSFIRREYGFNYKNNYGFVDGLSAPTEAGPLFRYLLSKGNNQIFKDTFSTITNDSGRSIISKNLYNSFRISSIHDVFPSSIFIVMRRDSRFTIQSILRSREKLLDTRQKWFGLRYPGYKESLDYNPFIQAAFQIKRTNEIISDSIKKHDLSSKTYFINYEDLCDNPEKEIGKLSNFLLSSGACFNKKVFEPNFFLKTQNIVKLEKKDWKKINEICSRVKI